MAVTSIHGFVVAVVVVAAAAAASAAPFEVVARGDVVALVAASCQWQPDRTV